MNHLSNQCPLCSSHKVHILSRVKDVEYFTSDKIYEYLECGSCKSIYLKDPPINNLSEIYPDNYYSVKGISNEHMSCVQTILEKIKNYLDKKLFTKTLKKIQGETLNCLDVGGGSGWMMNLVRESDSRVTNTTIIDINEISRDIAESNGHRYINDIVDSLTIRNEFDFVLMLNLIEHVANPRRTLSTINIAMKSNGLLLIKTPNTLSLNRRLFEKLYWGGYHAPRHWVLFNKNNFLKLARECGFAIEKFSYTQGAPQWVASILGTINRYWPSTGKKPMSAHPLGSVLSLLFAVFDLVRLPLFSTDQMIVVLRKL